MSLLSDVGRSKAYDVGIKTIGMLQEQKRLNAVLPGLEAESKFKVAKLKAIEEAQAQQARIDNTRIPLERLPGFNQMGSSQQKFLLTMMRDMIDENKSVRYGDYKGLTESVLNSYEDGKKFIQMGIADTRQKLGALNGALQTQDKKQQKAIFEQFGISKPEEAQQLIGQWEQQLTMQVNNFVGFDGMHNIWKDLSKELKLAGAKHGVIGPVKWGMVLSKQDPILEQIGAEATAFEQAKKSTTEQKNYLMAKEQGYAGTFMDYQRDISKGTKTEIDPTTGKVTIIEWVGLGHGLEKTVKKDIQKEVIGLTDELSILRNIQQDFEPSYLEVGTKIGMAGKEWGEKLGVKLSPEDKQALKDFTRFKQNSFRQLNAYIKRITGAQMSESEVKRLTKAVADFGVGGVFSGDSPTVFKEKLDNVLKDIRMSIARREYFMKQGIPGRDIPNQISIAEMPTFINQRAQTIEREILGGQDFNSLTQEQQWKIQGQVDRILRGEFGI